jgi:hypothetical protein
MIKESHISQAYNLFQTDVFCGIFLYLLANDILDKNVLPTSSKIAATGQKDIETCKVVDPKSELTVS